MAAEPYSERQTTLQRYWKHKSKSTKAYATIRMQLFKGATRRLFLTASLLLKLQIKSYATFSALTDVPGVLQNMKLIFIGFLSNNRLIPVSIALKENLLYLNGGFHKMCSGGTC